MLDGDIVFDPLALEILGTDNMGYRNSTIVFDDDFPGEEDSKIVSDYGYVQAIGKKDNSKIKYTSIIRFDKKIYKPLYKEISKEKYWNTWYSEPLTAVLQKFEFSPLKTNKLLWDKKVIDIDTPEDFEEARKFYKELKI